MNEFFDAHVHIGQWKQKYFTAKNVFSTLIDSGKIGCNFMSTTSCKPLHFENHKEIIDLYKKVKEEILNAIKTTLSINSNKHVFYANPYYWVVPLFHKNGITFEQVFDEVPEYKGLKIHPKAHNWNPEIKERENLLTKVFEFAQKKKLPIIFHTGSSESDDPILFEKWFKNYPTVKVTLAHCKNLKSIINLFDKYPQLNGDISFIPKENFDYLISNGYCDRLIYGSDFPINKTLYKGD